MKLLDVPAGSEEWRRARLGVPSASQFSRIITASGKLSSSRDGYMHELLAERLMGEWIGADAGDFAARGTLLETEAIKYYELIADVDTQPGGFCLRDDGAAGCSPDRLIGDVGGLEIKCPSPAVHVGYLLGKDADKYKVQIQGSMWVTGRAWWDHMSYHPSMPPVRIRHVRDEAFISALSGLMKSFAIELVESEAKLRALAA